MIKKLSFQSKLSLTYSFFVVILMLFMGLGFYYYNSYIFEKDAYSRLNDLVIKISQSLDDCVRTMDYMSMDLISNEELISALSDLTYLDRNNPRFLQDFQNANKTLNSIVSKTLVRKMEFKVNIFNRKGDFFTNRDMLIDKTELIEKINRLDWIKTARTKEGVKYIVPPSSDVWSTGTASNVFSLVRMVRDPGYEIGFLEVQNSADSITQICSVGVDKDIKVIIINEMNQVIYSSEKIKDMYLKYYSSISENGIAHKNPYSSSLEIINRVHSDFTGWTVYLIEGREAILKPMGFLKNMTVFIGFGLTTLTFVFFFFFASQLTKPLRKLKKTMEEVQIENLPKPMIIQHENNEIESLNQSFQDMRMRLSEAINHELKFRSMQMRAHFDSLQAQINPHFMHNMLNVVANMGLEAGAEEVASTCRRISTMLRYSTSTDKRRTTIKDELEHVENYLCLMKKRFEHKLEFGIHVDQCILDIEIPKIVLQPLVENSISHGFEACTETMEIQINGFIKENKWQINIIDNGSGFSEDILKDLETRIGDYSRRILDNEDSKGLSIGGMGIISTFARLRLFYGKELKFVLKNNEPFGACISIGGSLSNSLSNSEAGGEVFVQNNDSGR